MRQLWISDLSESPKSLDAHRPPPEDGLSFNPFTACPWEEAKIFQLLFPSRPWIALLFLVIAAVSAEATIRVTLSSSPASPQPVGTTITWTATVSDTASGGHELQFRVATNGRPAAIVRDYSPVASFQWTPSKTEGTYTIRVVARNLSTSLTASTSASFTATSRLVNGLAAVNTTSHPLVALLSAPACQVPNLMRVRFTPTGAVPAGGITAAMTTNSVPCRVDITSKTQDRSSMNFYIAGMYPGTTYQMHWETTGPTGKVLFTGRDLSFLTGPLPTDVTFPATTVLVPATPPTSVSAPILIHDYYSADGSSVIVPTATDLSGNTLWYYPLPVSLLTRTEVGGNFFILYVGSTNPYLQIMREVDLAGNTVLETNAQAINEQLVALGRRKINAFHHEARRLPSGDIVLLGSDEMLVTNAQGGTVQNPVDVLGAQVIVLDRDLQVKWAWDAFDFLDITRVANLGEVVYAGWLPIHRLRPVANDWLHANSVQQSSDGNFIVSLRHQDWVIKINYANGAGDGHVMWRMGYQGDFTLLNPPTSPLCTTPDQQDAFQWFSHQHDANFQRNGNTILSVFDNGVLRVAKCDTNGNSRGYVLSVDEAKLQATPILISDLGNYSVALGASELIAGSPNYHFESGWIVPGPYSTSTEIAPGGVVAFALQEANVLTYRSYRMQNLYTPAPQ